MTSGPRVQLALVALVQVLVLALWFSASAVVPALGVEWGLSRQGGIWLTASVQVGFAAGALASAALNLADRMRPQVLIAASALLGAAATAAVALLATDAGATDAGATDAGATGAVAAVGLRFLTGFALAGVYPVGMKVLVSWFPAARGTALGVLIGAISLGSALPQLLTVLGPPRWSGTLLVAALLATLGAGVALAWVRPGPHARPSPPLDPRYVLRMISDRRQRLVTLGYLGHMWELYALWAWLPAYVAASYAAWSSPVPAAAVGITAFLTIGVAGAVGCVLAGRLSERHGSVPVALVAMLLSGGCAVASVVVFGAHPGVLGVLLLVWGAAVVADSAQFSAALSEVADPRYVGTALTVQTAAGFLLSILTIQALPLLADAVGWRAAVPLLAVGPLFGAVAMSRLLPVRTAG